MEKKKNIGFIILGYAIALIITLLIVTGGSFLNIYFPGVFLKPGQILLIVLLCVLMINLVIYCTLKKKYSLKNGQEILDYVLGKKEEVTKNYIKAEKKILRNFRLSMAYICLVYLLFAVTIAFFSSSESSQVSIILSLIFIFVLSPYFSNLLQDAQDRKENYKYLLKEEDYPDLFSFVRNVFNEEQVALDFHLSFTLGEDISISFVKNKLLIVFGVQALRLLTEDEMKAVLLHECAHFKLDDIKHGKKFAFYSRQMELMNQLQGISNIFFYPFSTTILFKSELYNLLGSIYHEKRADERVKAEGQSQNLINAVAKLRAFSIYRESIVLENQFATLNEIPKDICQYDFDCFMHFFHEHQEVIMYSLYHAITPRISTHPSLKERMEENQISEIKIGFQKNPCWLKDMLKLSDRINQEVYENVVESTKEPREGYLNTLKVYEEYRKQPEHTLEEKNNMMTLCDENCLYKEALQLAYEICQESTFNTRAKFLVGCLEIKMNLSNKGVEYLKSIIVEGNSSEFYMSAYQILGDYFISVGEIENIEWIRSIVATVYDKEQIYEELAQPNYSGPLFKADEDETYKGLLSLVEKEDCIACVACVKRKKEDFEITHVLVEYKASTTSEEYKVSHRKVWMYLDTAPVDRQYYLYSYEIHKNKNLFPFIVYQNNQSQ